MYVFRSGVPRALCRVSKSLRMAAPSATLARRFPDRATRASVSWPERAAGGAVLLVAAPLLGVAAAAVWGLSGQAPIVLHRRVGLGGSALWIPKLRTMWQHRERWDRRLVEYLETPPVPVCKHLPDPRVTSRFAAFCRCHSIDELPQLALVLLGHLQLSGPRPLTQQELDDYYAEAQHEVLAVPPGLTGLWQVMGRNRLTYAQRRRLDLFLVRHRTWRLTAWILGKTLAELIAPRSAW